MAGHSVHVSGVVAPRLSEYVPASHISHDPDPGVSLYSPALHAVHSLPSATAVCPCFIIANLSEKVMGGVIIVVYAEAYLVAFAFLHRHASCW